MRTATALLLALAAFGHAPRAADFEYESLAEAAIPDGSLRRGQIEVHPHGGVVISGSANSGFERVVMRLDAQGDELWRWVSPSHTDSFGNLALDVREDGVIGVVDFADGTWSYRLLSPDGTEIVRHALGLGREISRVRPVLAQANGFAVDAEINGPPWRSLHRFDESGVALATYSDSGSGCGMINVRSRAGGGFVIIGCAGLSGGRIRVLDETLRPVWTTDVGGSIRSLDGSIDAPGGAVLAFGHHVESPTTSRGVFALLNSDGGHVWSATTSAYPSATQVPHYIRVAPYSKDDGFGFVGTAGNRVSGSCLLEGTLTSIGTLSSACVPIPLVGGLEPLHVRRVPDGIDLFLIAQDSGGKFGQFVSKRGSRPSTIRDARWSRGPRAYVPSVALSDSGPVALIGDEDEYTSPYDITRMVRWEMGAQPVVDKRVPGDDAPHSSELMVDSSGEAVIAFTGRDHVDILRRGAGAWQRRFPHSGGSARLAEAADGSYRVLSGGTTPEIAALSRDGTQGWSYRFTAPIDTFSRMAAPADGTTLLAYATTDKSCRVRRLDALGNVTGDSALGAEGYLLDSATLEDGAVFTCVPIVYFEEVFYGPEVQVRVDASLSAHSVDTTGCRIAGESRVVALGGTRWLMTGRSLELRSSLRFCVFDDVLLVQSEDVEFDEYFSPMLHLGVHVDRAKAQVHVAGTLHSQPSIPHHVVYDMQSNSATAYPLGGNGALISMSGPDLAGRVAHAYTSSQGRIIELGLPALGAEWRATIPMPVHVPRLAMAGNRLWLAASDSASFDHIVSHLGVASADAIFDSGFELR